MKIYSGFKCTFKINAHSSNIKYSYRFPYKTKNYKNAGVINVTCFNQSEEK